ncbi:MAG: DUF5784 family protein [Halanaeroarchaeum sp.]
MAKPLRFRRSRETWSADRARGQLFESLDDTLGARSVEPWFRPPEGYEAIRYEMDNGDLALFAYDDTEAYWLGNTETPSVLWRTEKYTFEEVPYQVARWAQRELLTQLHEESPWLAEYPHVSWFFLPVFLSKDGRESSRAFFSEHAAGFPNATPQEALSFYERVLSTGALDGYRHTMAGKLGTSTTLDRTRMASAMAEFNAAWVLLESGYEIEPEAPVSTGHSIDYRASDGDEASLVEVTRPAPTHRRSVSNPIAAVRDTAQTKVDGQLDAHAGGISLFVDCSGFPDDDWRAVAAERPDVRHRPTFVYRTRPDGSIEGYAKGSLPIEIRRATAVTADDPR